MHKEDDDQLNQSNLTPLIVAGILVVLGFTSPQTRASHEAQGMVLAPRMNVYGVRTPAAENARFVYSGWVDFPGSEGYVQMDVLRRGNGEDEARSWAIDVDRGFISDTPMPRPRPRPVPGTTEVDGQFRYSWSTGDPAPHFRPDALPGGPPDDRFPDGGTARVRFVAVHFPGLPEESRTLLPALDEDGVPTGFSSFDQLILADNEPTPATPPPPQPGSSPFPTPNYLNRKTQLGDLCGSDRACQALATRAYYGGVGTNHLGGGASILQALPTLNHFKRRYFNIPAKCRVRFLATFPPDGGFDVDAVYFNKSDLGLGRWMHCTRSSGMSGCPNETACYVENFASSDASGRLRFGDFLGSSPDVALPFATVAMVSRGNMPVDAPNKVFFVVYDNAANRANPPLAYSAPLDTKGYNKFIPGNCLVCHGSGGSFQGGFTTDPNRPTPTQRVTQAYFLPFDLKSFLYYPPELHGLPREAQEGRFRLLNQLVFLTDIGLNHDAKELISGWYGGEGFPRATFDDNFVPEGWSQSDSSRQLYRHVVAPYCQTCHISHSVGSVFNPSPFRFGTFDDFRLFQGLIYTDVCVNHEMPNAEQTVKLMWGSSARPQLLDRLPIRFGCGWEPPGTGRTTALAGPTYPASAEQVFRDYKADSCACSTRDCLIAVEERFVGQFAAMKFDNHPSAAGAIAPLKSAALECHDKIVAKESPHSATSMGQVERRRLELERLWFHH